MWSLFLQIAVAAATPLGSTATMPAEVKQTILPAAVSFPPRVIAGPTDKNALDILNNTRPDILGHGAAFGCPMVENVYVDGRLLPPPPVTHGFSNATVYLAGDTVMVMLRASAADALRGIPSTRVRDIQYVDCSAPDSLKEKRNTLYVTTTNDGAIPAVKIQARR